MADNYLEKKMEDMQNRLAAKKAKEQRARHLAWKKRMDAYRRKLEAERAAAFADSDAVEVKAQDKSDAVDAGVE